MQLKLISDFNIQEEVANRKKPASAVPPAPAPVSIKFDETRNGYAAAHLLRVATGAKSFDIDHDHKIVTLYYTTEGDYIWFTFACDDLGWKDPQDIVNYKNYLSTRRDAWLRLVDEEFSNCPRVSGFVSAYHENEEES